MDFEIGKTYEELDIGNESFFSKTVSETDVYLFAGISGDFNPLHVNEQYARTTPFGARVAHGPLTQSLAFPLLGTKLPGLGTIAIEVSTRFKAPVYIGDTITVTGRVVEKIEKKKWVQISLMWRNQKAEVVAEGSATVSPPRKATS